MSSSSFEDDGILCEDLDKPAQKISRNEGERSFPCPVDDTVETGKISDLECRPSSERTDPQPPNKHGGKRYRVPKSHRTPPLKVVKASKEKASKGTQSFKSERICKDIMKSTPDVRAWQIINNADSIASMPQGTSGKRSRENDESNAEEERRKRINLGRESQAFQGASKGSLRLMKKKETLCYSLSSSSSAFHQDKMQPIRSQGPSFRRAQASFTPVPTDGCDVGGLWLTRYCALRCFGSGKPRVMELISVCDSDAALFQVPQSEEKLRGTFWSSSVYGGMRWNSEEHARVQER
ncbi:MAG: hypothetical protein M1816_002018 [Peltula sp. TS41687]|nr:MAG: hypothetical protein M1816_002018 [Peltula sp. TS41687]